MSIIFVGTGKELKYLDDRPVFPKERACAQAWEQGGAEAENEERQNWINKERRKIQESVDYVLQIRNDARAKKLLEYQGPDDDETEGNEGDNEEEVCCLRWSLPWSISENKTQPNT